jgi:hypothetical protein
MSESTASATNPVSLLTSENFSEWMIKIRAQLRQKKLWRYTQEPLSDDSKSTKLSKHEEAADAIVLTISSSIMQKLTESELNNGYLLLQRIKTILQPTGEAQFMRLSKELYTLQFKDFKTVDAYLTRIKILEEQIDATEIKLEGDKRTLLVLSITLPAQYRSLVQL